jgi:hypothetical protein
MANRQMPFGGGPRIGGDAPGEPANSPVVTGVAAHGGAPDFNGISNRGEKAVGPNPASEIHPAPYGGGNAFVARPNAKPASGSGDGTGNGATSGADVP